jgi:DNA gyrase subunit B
MSSDYSADQIQVLRGLEPVRKRPGMYIGDTHDGSGLLHLVWEVVGNVIDQHLLGRATELRIELREDGWVSIADDGPGLPVDDVPIDGDSTSALEAIFTRLHYGATLDNHYPHVHVTASLRGVGVAVVNALSERLEVETTRDGIRWTQSFERGDRASRLRRVGPSRLEGTTIRFRPDATIFGSVGFDRAAIRERVQELAWLLPKLRIYLQEVRVRARGGIMGWARELAGERGEVVASYALTQFTGDIRVDLAFAWNRDGAPIVHSFVNLNRTVEDGSHVDGVWRGFQEYARTMKSPARSVRHVREAVGCGLVMVVDVAMLDPRFGAPTRDQLRNPEAANAVRAALRACLDAGVWHTHRIRAFVDQRLCVLA